LGNWVLTSETGSASCAAAAKRSQLTDALNDDNVKQRIADIGATLPAPDQRLPAALHAFVKSEISKWGEVAKAAGASANP
jgi:tripartite-type tricarboxylate transporter receptor subunit TctC